jgi:hypothetical protein
MARGTFRLILDCPHVREQNENILISPERLIKLIEGMESRASTGFRVSSDTAPVIVEALRLYARMHAIEPANFRVENGTGRTSTARRLSRAPASFSLGARPSMRLGSNTLARSSPCGRE